MQIVIEIDEARFKDIQRIAEVQLKSNYFQTAEQIIAKGIPHETVLRDWSGESPFCPWCGAKMVEPQEREGTDADSD